MGRICYFTISVFLALTTIIVRTNGDDQQPPQLNTESSRRWSYDRKACFGTENGLTRSKYEDGNVKRLHDMYKNCSIVYGNLEVAWINWHDVNNEGYSAMDFFDNIEEVVGYVLIANNFLPYLSFPRLRIIWGDKSFVPQSDKAMATSNNLTNFSLFVMGNGLEYLDMRSLRAVAEGRVGVLSNNRMCHWKTGAVDWTQILGSDYVNQNRYMSDFNEKTDNCFADANAGKCSSECAYKNCWANGALYCQEIYRKNCAPQCWHGMCFNESSPLYCCSSECAAGCFGPTNRDCYGCRQMRDDGVCVDKCPPREVYNKRTAVYEVDPNGKFAWNRECVKTCPEHVFVYKDGCVARCPEGHYTEDNGTECKPCIGQCPKTCFIEKPLNALSIHEFANCTIIDGRIEIREDAFNGGADFDENNRLIRYGAITEADLDVLSDVERITHHLFVQSSVLKSLRFLRKLKQIDGRKKHADRYALMVSGSRALVELGLHNLKRISDGAVYVGSNENLCYADTLPWKTIAQSTDIKISNKQECRDNGFACDDLCDNATGCWGQGPDMCYECQYYEFNRTCIKDCPQSENLFAIEKKCDSCHHECNGCKGHGPRQCISCRNVQLEGECVSECPNSTHYAADGRCHKCHPNCFEFGCTGSGNFIGMGGCRKCRFAVVGDNLQTVVECLPDLSGSKECRSLPNLTDYFFATPQAQLRKFLDFACQKCNSVCKTCDGPGTDELADNCQCKDYRHVDPVSGRRTCVAKCERNTFTKMTIDSTDKPIECYPCHKECDTCYGLESTQCYSCKKFADYPNKNKTMNCTDVCPAERPFDYNNTCSDIDPALIHRERQRVKEMAIGIPIAVVFLMLIVICTIIYLKWRRLRNASYLQPDERFEMNPEAKPNLARLRLIVETELRRGSCIGTGAFGAVFKGVWSPDGSKAKIPVAIKVLHKATAAEEKEMLNEAGIMASMDHPCLLSLKGVCVGRQLMLITALLPLGSLLEYVHDNKSKIGSKALIRWCKQIAEGMAYLEERRLVHRDLAARNVLVQTPYRIRITDFGLAKMLDYGEDELKISNGKVPIKWLALECIQDKKYTHKSDVWAYGVTVWELLTFGEKPYKDKQLQDIQFLLEKGDRLSQPKICSIDLYMVLIKCWMVDANSRPSFKELAVEFSHMFKDPARYVDIEGDELRRLPSYTENEQKQMLEQLFNDPDVRDQDDFFSHTNIVPTTPISPLTPTSVFWNSGCAIDSNVIPHMRESVGRARAGQRQESTSSHRYASDPTQEAGKLKLSPNMSSPNTDVDNYLVPDSHFHQSLMSPGAKDAESTYMQLVENGLTDEGDNSEYYQHLRATISGAVDEDDAIPPRFNGMDNRVYILQTNNNSHNRVNSIDQASGDLQPEQESQELGRSSSTQSMTENESVV